MEISIAMGRTLKKKKKKKGKMMENRGWELGTAVSVISLNVFFAPFRFNGSVRRGGTHRAGWPRSKLEPHIAGFKPDSSM